MNKDLKKVHQIYFSFSKNKEMSSLFKKSINCFKKWCKKNNYEYMFWDEKKCNNLMLNFPEYLKMYNSCKYPIMKIDIARLCILYLHGGLYADLDCFPKIKKMKNSDLVLTIDKTSSGTKRKKGQKVVTNEIIQSVKKNIFLKGFLDYIKTQIKEKEEIKVYEQRKVRFVCHTTGPYALQRFLKINKFSYELYTTNQLEFNKNWKYIGLGDTKNVDFIAHHSLSWYDSLK